MNKFGKNSKLKSFEKLYFENYNLLCQTVYRFVKEEAATKDIVQDVFIKYWHKMSEIHITDSEAAYLRRASINAALNYLKEMERRGIRENRFAEDASTYLSENADTQLRIDETSNLITNTINQLPAACREAFVLSRYEEKSYKEIAEILSVSVNTVEKHIGKALKKLREVLKK